MFERKIEETISYLLKETIGDQDSITTRQIVASGMPTALRRLFDQDVDIWVAEEKERLLKGPHFRYDEQDVQELFEQIITRAREYAYFGREEYTQALEKNVKLLFNFVCRPQWTLVKYFFADREHAPADAVLEGLEYFHYYEYYRIILREYFEKKSLTVVNAKKFTELLEYIDQEVIRNFDSRKVAHLSEPVYELFSVGASGEEKFAPVEALSLFYDDKNLRSIVERLDREKEQREQLTLHDLVMLVSEVDYATSFDISEIVHERISSAGAMKPERDVTAGEDFEIPKIETADTPEERRKDIGEEEGDLDFVITEEENSVIAHAPEAMQEILTGDEIDEDVEEALDVTIEETEEEVEQVDETSAQEFGASGWDDEGEEEGDVIPEESETQTDEEDNLYALEEDIPAEMDEDTALEAQDDLPQEDLSIYDEELELEESVSREEAGETLSMDEASGPDLAHAEERDTIPEMSLDDMDELARAMNGETDVDEDLHIEIPDDDATLPDMESDLSQSSSEIEEDEFAIDWEKEAEDIPDVELDEEEEERTDLPDDTIPGISLSDDENLKPAEELLSQLDLEDYDEPVNTGEDRKSYNDIPIVEDETPTDAPEDDETVEEEEPAVPPEEVIAEYGDVKEQISASDRKKYIKKLFQKDENAFDSAMRVINGKPNWREASEYIDELFIKHDVDMYSRIAVKFTDDIYKRYLKK